MPPIPGLSWLMSKVGATIMAALVLILLVVAIVQTVQLYGFAVPVPIFGRVTLAEGAIPARDTAIKARDTAIRNQGTVQAGLDTCNTHVAALGRAGQARQAGAQAGADAKAPGETAAAGAAQRLLAVGPGANALVTALQIGTGETKP